MVVSIFTHFPLDNTDEAAYFSGVAESDVSMQNVDVSDTIMVLMMLLDMVGLNFSFTIL